MRWRTRRCRLVVQGDNADAVCWLRKGRASKPAALRHCRPHRPATWGACRVTSLRLLCRYLAIDGVAPRAKMNQQRSRRFRSQQEAKETREAEAKLRAEMEAKGMALPPPKPPSWDHNVITPGTPFMADLTAFLRKLVAERVAQHPAWRQLAVVLSDASVPGEGEHKLIEYVRTSQGQPGYDPNCRHVIMGDDAYLIMLLRALKRATAPQQRVLGLLLYRVELEVVAELLRRGEFSKRLEAAPSGQVEHSGRAYALLLRV